MWKRFKDFAFKGNALDLAVGVVIGSAFGKIVSSLVSDIIMPLISLLTGGVDFTSLSITLGTGENAAHLTYGVFIQNIVDFFIIAFSIFLVMSLIAKIKKKLEFLEHKAAESAEDKPAAPTEAQLLTEIRDILKTENRNGSK